VLFAIFRFRHIIGLRDAHNGHRRCWKHPPAFLLLLATGAGGAAGRLGLELAADSLALALASSSST
jgi:hypothetical protein